MIVQKSDELAFLHDAVVRSIVYEPQRGNRMLSLVATCNPDTGFPSWDGRTVRLLAADALYVGFIGLGVSTGEETIDCVSRGVGKGAERLLDLMPKARADASLTTVVFHSGSSLELVSSTLEIENLE